MKEIRELIYSSCHPGLINEIIIENEDRIHSNHSLGMIIPTFNRPEYLKYVFYSLSIAEITESMILLIFDDGSEEQTKQLIRAFKLKDIPIIKIFINKLSLVKQDHYTILPGSAFPMTIRYGFNILFQLGVTYVMNSDSDAILCKNWSSILFTLLSSIKEDYFIVSGSQTKFHKPISDDDPRYALLGSLGGLNFTCNKKTFYDIVQDAIYDYSFDWEISAKCNRQNIPIYLIKPSIVQHIGIHSSIIRGSNNHLSECYECNVEDITVDMLIQLDESVKQLDDFSHADDFQSELWRTI